ncbi:hypothetical protein KAFR_0A07530 [Kazachstania africana CBS 2517]|uniref:Uncharacterized protein n=1 Tax=Kazachstania africana (strain ATCC 22294 / BCRC 22015 / CBS 2517 / CECT 1963 / NBRC 1671 / NRRL Y-8276) TaxID=1071382 RepID=H2AP87_KAZAF|nr:hypothetical protein KAFR_0A07530 [Kazachstania africana CBS 2517]CCF56187.1 hypothetical protein KAFR_0A07530 [Kazachstania africana CBS 2517]
MKSIKCVVIGDGAVGKTSLLISYTTGTFPRDYVPTVFDNYTTTISLSNSSLSNSTPSLKSHPHSLESLQLFKLNLWDTAGQEEYDRLRPLSYPQTDIFLICFSVAESNSFKNVTEKWLPELKTNSNIENSEIFKKSGKYPILLVGTKSDLRDDTVEQKKLHLNDSDFVSQQVIDKFVKDNLFMGYVETSAATQTGVREVFETAVRFVASDMEKPSTKNVQDYINDKKSSPTSNINNNSVMTSKPSSSAPQVNKSNQKTSAAKATTSNKKPSKFTTNTIAVTDKSSKKSKKKSKCVIF